MNYLKKFGAVALAAVMAVTFAPVASLTAFASGDGSAVDKAIPIEGVDELDSKIYDVETATASGVVVVGEKKSATLVLVGSDSATFNGTVELKTGASLKIVNKSATKNKVTDKVTGTVNTFTSITLGQGATLTLDSSLGGTADSDDSFVDEISKASVATGATIKMAGGDLKELTATGKGSLSVSGGHVDVTDLTASGNVVANVTGGVFKGALNVLKNKDKNKTKIFGTAPAVTERKPISKSYDKVYVGSDYVASVANNASNSTIYVVNGAVKIDKLSKGNVATVSPYQFYGDATLTATPADKTSLAGITTKFSYKWENGVTGTGTYTTSTYVSGAEKIANYLNAENSAFAQVNQADDLPTTLVDDIVGITSGATKLPEVNYDRAIALTVSSDDNISHTIKNLPEDIYSDPWATGDTLRGITYFTADPSAYATSASAIAVIDGTKYVVGSETEGTSLQEAAASATKTVEFKRLSGYDDTNKNTTGFNKFTIYNPEVKITASADEVDVLTATTEDVYNGSTRDSVYVEAFGSKYKTGSKLHTFAGFTTKNTTNAKRTIYASQIAKGTTVDTDDQAFDVTASRADGIEYYSVIVGSANTTYTFGSAADAKAQLSKDLSGYTENGIHVDAIKNAATIFVSAGIKGTFSPVQPKVVMDGELSEDVKANADGTNTWVINEGYTSDAIPAYRMYRKSGEHVYTISAEEVKMLEAAGWINEGRAFYVNPVVTKKGTPVYRVYNKNNGGMHFYTANAAEKDMLLANGWTEGAVVFYGADKATGIPVYRTYNTGSNNGEHNYTTNIKESDMNVKAGWRAEGVAFYVFK